MKKIRERALRLESLEDRMLLAVTAGIDDGDSAAAPFVAEADPLPTDAQLATPEITGTSSASSKRVTLNWGAVSGASSYTVAYRQAAGDADWRYKTGVTGTSTTISALNSNYGYEFKVMAVGSGSYTDSDYSASVAVVPDPGFTTVVTTLADAELGDTSQGTTLRQAVHYAALTNNEVTFADGLSGTITLTCGEISAIDEATVNTIAGFSIDGDNRITVTTDAQDGRGRLFFVKGAGAENITFKNITLTGATATEYENDPYFTEGEGQNYGSAIMFFGGYNAGTANVFLDNVTVTDCTGSSNGTVYFCNINSFTMTNCTITGNEAYDGGGLFVQGCENAVIADCTITENTAYHTGGGAVLASTSATIDNTSISNNNIYSGSNGNLKGGGLYVSGAVEGGAYQYTVFNSVSLTNCHLDGNYIGLAPESEEEFANAQARGGGVFIYNANFTTNECTISGNTLNATECNGGGLCNIYIDSYGYESTDNGNGYRPANGKVRLNKTYLNDNTIGTFYNWVGGRTKAVGGAIWLCGDLTLVDCVVTGNTAKGNGPTDINASAIYDYCNNNAAQGFATHMFVYYTTIAGNKSVSYNGSGLGEQSAAIRDFGNSYFWGSVLLGNQTVNMNGTDDAADDVVNDLNMFTFALAENGVDLPRFLSSALDKNTMIYPSWFEEHADWHYGYSTPGQFGTNYDDAECTHVSANQGLNGGSYIFDDNVYVDGIEGFFNDFAGGDYTLAKNSPAVDAINMDIWGNGFGYEYDIRGEGYYRVVNDIADIGAYELQAAKPSFTVTVTGWEGAYDGEAHSVSVSGLEAGDITYYSADGTNYSTTKLSYTDPGTYTTYVKVERAGYEDFYGSADVVINDAVTKLSVAVIVSNSMASATEVAVLPESISTAAVGDTVYVQVWVKNIDGSDLGCTGGYIDVSYTNGLSTSTFTPSSIYNSEANRANFSVSGLVSCFGGCAAGGVNDLGVSQWALLGTLTVTADAEGEASVFSQAPTLNGREIPGLTLARAGQGNVKSSEIEYSYANFTVQAGGGEQLAAPSITNSTRANYISFGANRHQLQWSAVANASGYQVTYSEDGATWKTVNAADTKAVITGLTYGADVQYKVKALGTGAYTDSDWSRAMTFNVCPMDINGDGEIAGTDRALLAKSWMAEEGDDEYFEYADINADGEVAAMDRTYIANNWMLEAGDEDLVYPRPVRADAVAEAFASGIDVDLDVF